MGLRLEKRAAAGVDGETWSSYGQDLDARLLDLQDRVHRGSYHPQPVRRVTIPKPDGRTRPRGIPALEDKSKALAERLAKFGLKLHPDRTRVLRFGRFALLPFAAPSSSSSASPP